MWIAVEAILITGGLALTPLERYSAMRRLNSHHPLPDSLRAFLTHPWFIWGGILLIGILLISLVLVRRKRTVHEKYQHKEQFRFLCDQRGLTAQQREILTAIARQSRAGRMEEVFFQSDLFVRGASQLMQEYFASGHNLIERKKMNVLIGQIKQKLGFQSGFGGLPIRRGRDPGLSSRDIPVGKTVSIALSTRPEGSRVDAVVIQSDEFELVLRPEIPVSCPPGEHWNVRYRLGTSTYEFDALTMVCGSDGLELSHTESVRFLNRRRFLRVPVEFPAQVAPFPVQRQQERGRLVVPQFVPATVTEISGPGLRIHTELATEHGQRLLVVFELEPGKVIQDIGEVRGLRDTAQDQSIGVELVGLDDTTVNELIRTTNAIAIRRDSQMRKMNAENPEMVATSGERDHG
ncbi:MAG: PilZ domain-containing protein [Phycisphaerae bacterium]|nr:PilZ domain-containing protein [Phycisphaerae bacterium]